jgi:ribonuclease BN (tRNA processing enzyme)
MRVVFVGTSDAFGAGGRRQAAIFVAGSGGGLLLDCAPGTTSGLTALGIERSAIAGIAISHFHADHFAGLPQFLLAAIYEDQRQEPLWVAGPPGVEQRFHRVADAMGYGLQERELPFPLHFVEFATDREVQVGSARISAFATHHHPETRPHGFRLVADRRTIAYTGDTGWFDALPERLRGADLAISECTFFERANFDHHLDYATLAARADRFACGRLILTHLGPAMAERRGRLDLETADDGLELEL